MNTRENDKSKEPQNDYLWDRSGAPDPEIQRLESVLSEFRYEERPLVLPAESPSPVEPVPTHPRFFSANPLRTLRLCVRFLFSLPSSLALVTRRSPLVTSLAATALLLALTTAAFVSLRPKPAAPEAGWNLSDLEGAPQIGSQTLSSTNTTTKLKIGQTLTTNSSSRVSISENDLGQIQVDPNSQLRLLQSGSNHKRIQLDRGTIHAYIWAPPTQFVVDTPSAVAVDLGCAYTLHVEPDGSGIIRTTLGWVGFHLNGRDSFIPAGAMCRTRRNVGPDTPYFEDASERFRQSLAAFDSAAEDSTHQDVSLSSVLAQSRPKDALTLWHLLSRTSGRNRHLVYHRLADLVPPPAGVTRDGILQLDPHMLDLYWNALNLGDISIWRFFEQSSAPTSQSGASPALKTDQLLKKAPPAN
jgi:FecR protein